MRVLNEVTACPFPGEAEHRACLLAGCCRARRLRSIASAVSAARSSNRDPSHKETRDRIDAARGQRSPQRQPQEEYDRADRMQRDLAALSVRSTDYGLVVTLRDVHPDVGNAQLRSGGGVRLSALPAC
jgi:hypothetical protein